MAIIESLSFDADGRRKDATFRLEAVVRLTELDFNFPLLRFLDLQFVFRGQDSGLRGADDFLFSASWNLENARLPSDENIVVLNNNIVAVMTMSQLLGFGRGVRFRFTLNVSNNDARWANEDRGGKDEIYVIMRIFGPIGMGSGGEPILGLQTQRRSDVETGRF